MIYSVHCGDALWILPTLEIPTTAVLLTDPPYGIAYKSGKQSALARSIRNDHDTSARDAVLAWWGDRPALVFGSWRRPRPTATRTLLVWDTKGALGMGDLSIPWKPAHQEIYVLGKGFAGRRTSDVLTHAPVQSMAKNGRVHPHEKPVALLVDLLSKVPAGWTVIDPFCGSGTTGMACAETGHDFIGIEIDPDFAALAESRIAERVLRQLVGA